MRPVITLACLLPLALSAPAALAAADNDAAKLHLSCRGDGDAGALEFAIDFAAYRATEATSGARYGVTVYRDGLGLWDAESGPGAVAYRIAQDGGHFVRTVAAGGGEGRCERAVRQP